MKFPWSSSGNADIYSIRIINIDFNFFLLTDNIIEKSPKAGSSF